MEGNIVFFYRNHKVGYSIKKVSDTLASYFENITKWEVPSEHATFGGILSNFLYVYKHRTKTGINHITGDIHYCIMALIGLKTVLTIHDTSAYDMCKNPLKKIIVKYLWFVLPLWFSKRIVCISSKTLESLKRFTKRQDIIVIGNAIDKSFIFSPKKFNSERPVVLMIGTAWNKNIGTMLKALEGLNCHIIIIGNLSPDIKNTINCLGLSVENKQGLTDYEIVKEYIKCDIVAFCSIYEGFGMPIIEGNMTGRVVITSDIEPLKEIGGNSVLYTNPYDYTSIRRCFDRLINEENLYDDLVEKGINNVKRFSLDKIASQYEQIYNDL